MAQCQEPVHPISNLCWFNDEPVWNFYEKDPVHGNYPVYETGFNELEEVLSRFQAGSSSNSDMNQPVHLIDEKKKRRMESNRESARRSRWRKKTHLENLTSELKRLKVQNQEFKNRFSMTLCANQLVRKENDRFNAESLVLCARLSNLSQILLARQLMLNPVMTPLLT